MKMKRIVVGLDGSTEAARALEWAGDLALLTGAEITTVTVFDAGPYLSFGMAPGPMYVPDFEQVRVRLHEDLTAWCEPLRQRGVVHHAVVRDGPAAAEILKETDSQPTDLVVVGSRGRGGFGELFLGSVAHYITQHSKHPVLVVPRLAVSAEAETRAPAATLA